MAYIIQNAIQIFHNGNSIILNSRFENDLQKYEYNGTVIQINGGKTKFIFETKNLDESITIKNLSLTYDSSINDLTEMLLWAHQIHINNKVILQWDFAKNLKKEKIEIMLEDNFATYNTVNPYVYKVLSYIYNEQYSI